MLKKLFLILAAIGTLVSLFSEEEAEIKIQPPSTKYLFVLYDAGETLALKGVLEKLKKEQADFKILVMGTAADLIKKEQFPSHRIELKDLGVEENVDKNWDRNKELACEGMQKISSMKAEIVVTGVASSIQGQVLDAFKDSSKTFAFWDNFNPAGTTPYFSVAKKVQEKASVVLFPSFYVASSPEFEKRNLVAKRIVGQPTLEQWKGEVESVNASQVKEKLNISPNKKVITFIGGYGKTYERAFALFVKSVRKLQDTKGTASKGQDQKIQVIVQIHPKTDGKWEKDYCAKTGVKGFLFPANETKISTIEAVAASDYVVCYDSTVGFQALSLGKNVLFAIPEKDPLRNIAIDLGLAKRVSCPEAFAKAITEDIEKKDFFATFGVPKNSVDLMVSAINEP